MTDVAPWAVSQVHQTAAEASKHRHGDELLAERVRLITTGGMIGVASPWPLIDSEVRCNLPGSITVLCGDPGSAKSLLTLQLFHYVQTCGVKCAIQMLESPKAWHLARLASQLAGEPGMTDLAWVRENSYRAESIAAGYANAIRDFAVCLDANPDGAMEPTDLLAWVEDRCKAGCKLIGVDPVTALKPSNQPWIDDFYLMQEMRRIIEAYGAAAWIVTHPKKGRKLEISMDVLSGGAAYSRFTNSVMWLEKPKDPMSHVLHGGGTIEGDRIMHVLKARDGVATGKLLSMSLTKGLTFDAHGWIREFRDAIPEDDTWKNM
jgi:hypothetical protein